MTEASRRLRAAREQAGLSVEELSARTRIKVAFLRAIERGEFEQLPGEFFTRAFLRTYARELGLAPDQIVAEYDTSRGVADTPATHPAHTTAAAPKRNDDLEWSEPGAEQVSLSQRAWPLAALVALVLLVVFLVTPATQDQPSALVPVGTTGVVEPAEQPLAGAHVAPEPEPDMLRLDIEPRDVLWIAATADGERVVYRLVPQGERITVEGQHELSFRVGNAAAFDYTINGVPGRPVGGPGEVVEFRITRDNHRSFRR